MSRTVGGGSDRSRLCRLGRHGRAAAPARTEVAEGLDLRCRATPRPRWWRWSRPRSCRGCRWLAMVRLQGQADAATGMVATDAGLEAASLPAGCHGRVASFAQSDLGGSDAPPRHLPLWESQPLLAPAPPLLPCSGESLLAAASTPSDAAAALALRGGQGCRCRTGAGTLDCRTLD